MDDLPPLYARWMRAAAGGDVPRESVATCTTCVMLPSSSVAPEGAATFFHPATKCCTYLPELPNFLAGGVLDDATNHPLGTASVERRIEEGVEVTPLGLGRARSYLLVYDDGGPAIFGRARGMRCPHYLEDGGACGVWQHRESTCATWFCKHVRGAVGGDMWKAIQRVLSLAERDLAWWCVGELGLDPAAVGALLAHRSKVSRAKAPVTASELDRTPAADHAALWGTWAGRERELYRACAAKVRALSWDDVLRIGGPDLALAADVMRSVVRGGHAPDRLAVAPFQITALHAGAATITTYNAYDPLTLPIAIVDVLAAFDGRPTAEVLAALANEREIELEPALVQRLFEFGILAAAKP